eukprot:GHVT01038461.1.p2 GENE.GHVT01038461.1~~GHVT01038461.1.p2  ORF type:complete len:126 (-),score=12.34 GHVT01038461.1:1080-1457(-)
MAGLGGPASAAYRSVGSNFFGFIKFRFGRLYHSFYYAQNHTKYVLAFGLPATMWWTRWKVDTKLGYNVYMTEEDIHPDNTKTLLESKWKNGTKFYLADHVTPADLKKQIYGDHVPEGIKARNKKY